MHNCINTSGCCRVDVDGDSSFRFKIVYNQSKSNIDACSRKSSQLWDRISITSDWPTGFLLLWQIIDESNCIAAKQNMTHYACTGKLPSAMTAQPMSVTSKMLSALMEVVATAACAGLALFHHLLESFRASGVGFV